MRTAIIILKNTKDQMNIFEAAFSSYRKCLDYMKLKIHNIASDTSESKDFIAVNPFHIRFVIDGEETWYDFLRVNLSDPLDFDYISMYDELREYIDKTGGEVDEGNSNSDRI